MHRQLRQNQPVSVGSLEQARRRKEIVYFHSGFFLQTFVCLTSTSTNQSGASNVAVGGFTALNSVKVHDSKNTAAKTSKLGFSTRAETPVEPCGACSRSLGFLGSNYASRRLFLHPTFSSLFIRFDVTLLASSLIERSRVLIWRPETRHITA